MRLENIQLDEKTGLYFDVTSSTDFTVNDLKWINSGYGTYLDESGKEYYFKGVKVINGVVYYKKVIC